MSTFGLKGNELGKKENTLTCGTVPESVFCRLTNMATSLALTDNLIVLGFSHGALRLYFRDTGTLYCEVNAHASAVTALTFCPSISTLLTAGEDSFVRIWRIEEHQKDFKVRVRGLFTRVPCHSSGELPQRKEILKTLRTLKIK